MAAAAGGGGGGHGGGGHGGGGGGGDLPLGYTWSIWVDGNQDKMPAPAERNSNKAKVAHLLGADSIPAGVEEKEYKRYDYQPSTGNPKVDKDRNGLVDDYNAIVNMRLNIYSRMKYASGNTIRDQIREVLKVGVDAKKRHDQLHQERRRPSPYPIHFAYPPKLKD